MAKKTRSGAPDHGDGVVDGTPTNGGNDNTSTSPAQRPQLTIVQGGGADEPQTPPSGGGDAA